MDLDRPKRSRTNFTDEQLEQLELSFAKNQYLVGQQRIALSKRLRLTEAQVKTFFLKNFYSYHEDDFEM